MSQADRKKLATSGVLSSEGEEIRLAKLERHVHADIENWLRQREIFYVHSRTDKRTTNAKGVPDFIFAFIFSDRELATPIGVEIKVNGNWLSDEQESTMTRMQNNGWHYYVVESLTEMLAYLHIAPAP